MRFLLFTILFQFLFSLAHASLRPVLISPAANTPASLFFVQEGEQIKETFERYVQHLNQNSMLKSVSGANTAQTLGYAELNPQLDYIVVIANNISDFNGEAKRMRNLKQSLQDSTTQVIQVPVGLLSFYNAEDRSEIKKWINKNIKMMIVPGGDDIDPSLYSEKNTHSRNTNIVRDTLEAEIVKDYIDYKKGFTLGICRGHQLISSLLGYKLIQDIPIQTGLDIKHADDWHPIKIKSTRNNILAKLLNVKSDSEVIVNSLHHQSVIYHTDGPLELAGTTTDKTTEALEFKNGLGITLQFHPEYMQNSDGEKILSGIKDISKQNWKSCKSQFR